MRWLLPIALVTLLLPSWLSALEYLTDNELALMDGYTSSTLVRMYDDEGKVVFHRSDKDPCENTRTDKKFQADKKFACGDSLNEEHDRLLSSSFQRYLDQALDLMEAEQLLDIPGDGFIKRTFSATIEDASATYYMCRKDPAGGGLIHMDGITVRQANGQPMVIPTVAWVDHSAPKKRIMYELGLSKGEVTIDAIRIGVDNGDLGSLPSIGQAQISEIGSMLISISRNDD